MHNQPWEIRQDDSREPDSITTFIIFCEDANSEPSYFRSFEIGRKLKINAIPDQKQSKLNFLNTVTKCVEEGKMELTTDGYKLKKDVTENIWSVYDRDLEHTDLTQIARANDINFTTAIHHANATGVKVAWSNDVFELWILLHFETIPTGQRLHRNHIYDRLTKILKTAQGLSKEFADVIANPRFRYEDHAKKRNNFIRNILPLLKGKTDIAIQNATALETQYPGNIPFHDRNPCTMVHHLVRELMEFQPK